MQQAENDRFTVTVASGQYWSRLHQKPVRFKLKVKNYRSEEWAGLQPSSGTLTLICLPDEDTVGRVWVSLAK